MHIFVWGVMPISEIATPSRFIPTVLQPLKIRWNPFKPIKISARISTPWTWKMDQWQTSVSDLNDVTRYIYTYNNVII